MPVPLRPRQGTFFQPFSGFGGGSQSPLVPSQQEVDKEAEAIQEEDGGNIFFDLLRVPSRLLGGESLKLGLKQGAEDGVGGFISGVIQNNPLFQILDVLPGVDIVEDTDFVEVREAFGDNDAREGFGNVAINILGELATSPLELFWSPFGKTAAGLKAASGELSKQTLEEAVVAGSRAAMTFNFPLAGTKHVTFKNFDVYMARVLDATADWFNTSPVTQPLVRLFSQRALGVAGKANRVGHIEAVEGASEAAKALEGAFFPKLKELTEQYPDIMKENPDLGRISLVLAELGFKESDDVLEATRLLQNGLPYARSRTVRDTLLEGLDDAGEAARALERHMDGALRNGNMGALADDIRKWQEKYPLATIPKQVLDEIPADELTRIGAPLRPGIDTADFRQGQFREVSGVAAKGGGFDLFSPEGQLLEDAGAIANEKVLNVNGVSETVERASTTEKAIFEARQKDLSIFQDVVRAGDGELLDRVKDAAIRGRELMEMLGQKDMAEGLITGMLENYIPRVVTDSRVLAALDNQFSKFFEGRKLSELTISEANALLLSNPSKALKFRSALDVFGEAADPSKAWTLMEKIFPDSWLRGLRKLGQDGVNTAEFFDTNPTRVFYQRIKSSSQKLEKQTYTRLAVDELAKISTTLDDVEENARLTQEGYRAFLVADKSRVSVLSASETIEPALRHNQFVTASLTKRSMTEDISRRLIEERVPHKEVLDELRQLRDFQVVDTQALKKRQGLIPKEGSIPSGNRFQTSVDVKDLPKKYQSHPYVRAVQEQQDLLRVRDTGWQRHLDDEQLQTVRQARDVEAAVASNPRLKKLREDLDTFETDALEGVGKVELRIRDLIMKRGTPEEVLKDVRMTLQKLAGEAKGLRGAQTLLGKQKPSAGIRDAMRAFREELGTIKGSMDTLKADSSAIAEVGTRMRKAYADFDQKVKAVAREERDFAVALRRNAGKFERDGKAAFKAREDAARSQVESLRQGIRNSIDQEEQVYREFVDAVKTGGRQGKEEINQTLEAMLGPNRKMDNAILNDALAIFREQRENGVLPLDWVLENFEGRPILENIQKNLKTPLKWMDKNVYEASFGKSGYVSRLARPDFFGRSLGALDGATQWWKAYTVLWAPFANTRLRDKITNDFMQVQGMATENLGLIKGAAAYAGAQKDAYKFAKAYKQWAKTGSDTAFDGVSLTRTLADGTVETLTGKELFQTLHNKGLAGTAMFRDEVHIAGAEAVLLNKAQPKFKEESLKYLAQGFNLKNPKNNTFIRLGADIASFWDDHAKAAGFMARWKAGATVDEAAQGARAWAYIPERADLSHAERYVLRRLLPFYSWSKTAVKTQVNAFLARPATQTWLEKVRVSAINGSGLSEAEYEMLMPEYIQDNLGLPTSVAENGEMSVRLFGSFIPVAEVARLAKSIQDTTSGGEGGFFQNIGQQMNPWLKVPLETLMNESFYTQRDIERFDGEEQHFLGANLPSKWVHTLKSLRILNEIDALGIFTAKDIQTVREATIRNEDPFGVPILGTGRALDPLIPARGKVVDLERQAKAVKGRQTRDLNLAKHQINRAAENGTELDQQNLEALRKVLLRRLAEQQVREGAEERFTR